METEKEISLYQKEYSETGFWSKLFATVKKAGSSLIETALMMYYSAKDPSTPKWAKTIVIGALGYFILPADAVPDAIPAAGFADDLWVNIGAFTMVAAYIKETHKEKARKKMENLFLLRV